MSPPSGGMACPFRAESLWPGALTEGDSGAAPVHAVQTREPGKWGELSGDLGGTRARRHTRVWALELPVKVSLSTGRVFQCHSLRHAAPGLPLHG